MPVSVGIDLGTTYSAVAVVDENKNTPHIIPNLEGAKITPSVIQFVDGNPIFGAEAESAFNAGEPNCAATFKRNMGKDEPYCVIDGHSYTAEDLSALLLRHLKEDAEAVLGDSICDAVITVPAYFYSPEREATMRAAEAAGLKVKKIIDEPNAAAMAYGLNNWRENANILVYDLGGGTFDVTLVKMTGKGNLVTVVTRGDHYLGGRDWDNRIEQCLLEKFVQDTGEEELGKNTEAVALIRGATEGVKKKLSTLSSASATIKLPGIGMSTVNISREEFERNTRDLLERTGVFCRAVLEEAELSKEDVTDVLLVGGSTRMPQVSDYLQNLFGKKPITHVNPDEAVALGAAIQATKQDASYVTLQVLEENGKKVTDRTASGLTERRAVQPSRRLGDISSLTLRETTAHAMGIIAINDEGNRYYNEIIIPANHPRPVRAAKRFLYFTKPDVPNELEIYVLQGDSDNPTDCLIPYKFIVSGIQHVNKGERIGTVIRVQYSYDINGIINIQARQGSIEKDLPIRKDRVPSDISVFGRPVVSGDGQSDALARMKVGAGTGRSVVHKFRPINFSNVEWEKFDKIPFHPSGAQFNEPSVHIKASEKNIEFHGYNVSEMNEGVAYTINADDDFEIECDIDTSKIQPHPGGNLIISLGIISASLNENGGNILLDGDIVANVGSRFNLRMVLNSGGHYGVYIDKKLTGERYNPTIGGIDVIFAFAHGSHCCQLLSHAYVSNIDMMQRDNSGADDDSSEVPTWDD